MNNRNEEEYYKMNSTTSGDEVFAVDFIARLFRVSQCFHEPGIGKGKCNGGCHDWTRPSIQRFDKVD